MSLDDSRIELHNFEEKLPKHDPKGNSLFGLVDMGSNDIRFSISDLTPPRSRLLHCIYRERAGISLYDALHSSTPDSVPGEFPKETIEQVAATMKRFRAICDRYGVPAEQTSVFATEAMRTAKNRIDMVAAIQKQTSWNIDILSPETESLFGAMGARSGFSKVDGLFMDLGGGSVQMTYLNSSFPNYEVLAAERGRSMPFGAARLSRALSIANEAAQTRQDLQNTMKSTFDHLREQFPSLAQAAEGEGVDIYFCGGGFRGYGSMLMHTHATNPYPIPSIGGFSVPGEHFVQYEKMLHTNESEGENEIFGLSKRRRQQFPAIATVVEALCKAVPKIRRVTFCSGGNREGVLFMKLPKEVREVDPVLLLPGCESQHPEFLEDKTKDSSVSPFTSAVVGFLETAPYPARGPKFPEELLPYVACHIWDNMGAADETNASRALNEPISGILSDIPGLDHKRRACLALAMCARWGPDLGPKDRKIAAELGVLLGEELTMACEWIGVLARLLGQIFTHPVPRYGDGTLYDGVAIETWEPSPKGHTVIGVRLSENLGVPGPDPEAIRKMLKKIPKSHGLKTKIKVKLVD